MLPECQADGILMKTDGIVMYLWGSGAGGRAGGLWQMTVDGVVVDRVSSALACEKQPIEVRLQTTAILHAVP